MPHRAAASPRVSQYKRRGHFPCPCGPPAGACSLLLLKVLVQSRGCLLLPVPLSCRSVPIEIEQPAGAGPFPETFTAAMLPLLQVQLPGGGRLQDRREAVSRACTQSAVELCCLVHSCSWRANGRKAWCSQKGYGTPACSLC